MTRDYDQQPNEQQERFIAMLDDVAAATIQADELEVAMIDDKTARYIFTKDGEEIAVIDVVKGKDDDNN